jgi:hypothetical protein
MGLFRDKVIEPVGGGRFAIHLRDEERELLASLPLQLKELVDGAADDPWLKRLFPPAYHERDDADKQQEWHRLMGEDLVDRRRQQLDVLAATAMATELDEDSLHVWSQAINDLRLYLGTRLDVTEDTDIDDYDEADPDHGLYVLYGWLSYVQDHVVTALSRSL